MADTNKQIKQMVNFIMQEAHEKVNEIRIKTEHDFNLEKQLLVHNGKLKIQEEYAQKEKDLEVEQRVARSSAVGTARVKKMKSRDELLEQLKTECLGKLGSVSTAATYPQLMQSLIMQGLIKIEEQTVEIQCRSEDKAIVTKVLPDALKEYQRVMKENGHTVRGVDPKVSISKVELPSKSCCGGVILTACNNRIVLNQTLDERLIIAYTDLMPDVRAGLFGKALGGHKQNVVKA
jgi:V-type H+-transporting ATPase subunit E